MKNKSTMSLMADLDKNVGLHGVPVSGGITVAVIVIRAAVILATNQD